MAQTPETGELVTTQTTKLLDALAAQGHATLHSRSADSVHDVRVAIRRFGQVLAVFKPYFHARDRRKIQRELKQVISLAGDVRDRDIAIDLLGESRSPVAAALATKLRVQREEAETALLAALRRWIARKSAARWRTKLLPVQPASARPEQLLTRRAGKFFRSGDRAAAADSSVIDLHRFRIQSKKFRYSVELFRPVYEEVAEEWVEQIKRVQTLLGEMNDYRVARELVAELDSGAAIVKSFKRKQEKKADAFRKLWSEEYSGAAKQWVKSLKAPPSKPARKAGAARKSPATAAR